LIYILLQWEQDEWRPVGYPQMQYPNSFTDKSRALDVAWGLYEGLDETLVRRSMYQVRPRGWRLPSVMYLLEIQQPPSPHVKTI